MTADAHFNAVVYGELRSLANAYMRHQRPDHTLQATALVNEAYLRLARADPEVFNDRSHFMAVAATAMRQILIRHAESHTAVKRGGVEGPTRIHLDAAAAEHASGLSPMELLAIDAAVTRLEAMDARKARVVEAKIFGGLTHEDIARVIGVSVSTVENDWRMAKAWLAKELEP